MKTLLPNKNKKTSTFLASFLTAVMVGAGLGVSQFAAASDEGEGETPVPEVSFPPVEAAESTVTATAAVDPFYISAVFGGTTTLTVTFSNSSASVPVGIKSFDIEIPSGVSYQTNSSFVDGTTFVADPAVVPPGAPGDPTTLSYDPAGDTPLLIVPQGTPGIATLQLDISRTAGSSGAVQLGSMGGLDEGDNPVGPTTADFFATPAPTVLPVSVKTSKNVTLVSIPLNIVPGTGATVDAPATCVVDPSNSNCEKNVTAFQVDDPTFEAGTFVVDGLGDLSFTPVSDFMGTTEITYRGFDNLGQYNQNTVLVDVVAPPTVSALFATAGTGRTGIELTPEGTASPGTTLVTAATCLKENVSAGSCLASLVLPEQGTLAFNGETNRILFTPVEGYEGVVTAYYEMQDDLGGVGGNTIEITLSDTTAVLPISGTTGSGSTATLTPDVSVTPGETIASICLQPESDSDPSECVSPLTTSAGVWLYNSEPGTISFTPSGSFVGTATAFYKVTDSNGASGVASASVNVIAAPTVAPVAAQTRAGGTVVLTPNATPASGTTIDTTLTCLLETETSSTCGTTVATAAGVFTLDTSTNTVSFTAGASATGITAVFYRVTDSLGTNSAVTNTSTMTVTLVPPPVMGNLTGNARIGGAPWESSPNATPQGDTTITQALTCIKPTETGTCTASIPFANEGTFTYNVETGKIVFTPLPTSTITANTTREIWYQVTDSLGSTASAKITMTVQPQIALTAGNITGTAVLGGPEVVLPNITLTPTGNTVQSVCFKLTQNATTCSATLAVSTTTSPAQPIGTYEFRDATKQIVFKPSTPAPSPAPTQSQIFYQVTTTTEAKATGSITVTFNTTTTPATTPTVTVILVGDTASIPLCAGTVRTNCIGNATDTFDASTVEIYNGTSWVKTPVEAREGSTKVGVWTVTANASAVLVFTKDGSSTTTTPGSNVVPTPNPTATTGPRSGTLPVVPNELSGESANVTLTPRSSMPSSSAGVAAISVRVSKLNSTDPPVEQRVSVTGLPVVAQTQCGAGTLREGDPIPAGTVDVSAYCQGTGTEVRPTPETPGGTGTNGGTGGLTPGGTGGGASSSGITPVVPTGVLPETGGNAGVPVALGFLLIVAGGMLLTVWGRQRKFNVA